MSAPTQTPLPVGLWVVVIGAVGFAAGFFGPMLLQPEANQGPLVGLFITGPGGALLGLALGVIFRFLPVTNALRWRVLASVAAALGVGTLIACFPEPQTQGLLVKGVVLDCRSPAALASGAIERWDKRVADAHWMAARPGWREDAPRMIRTAGGVALTFEVHEQNVIRKHRKPWNEGRIDARGWRRERYQYEYFADFAGDDCEAYSGELPTLYVRVGQFSPVWPPDDAANFLTLARVEPASPQQLAMAK